MTTENDPTMSPFSNCTTVEEIKTHIDSALYQIDEVLARQSNEANVKEALDLLISMDRHLEIWLEQNGSISTVFTVLWKKLIGFLKVHHSFISRDQAHRLLHLFLEHALVDVKILSALYSRSVSPTVDSSCAITTAAIIEEFMSHLSTLTSYCQRISAILSFCSSILSGDEILVESLEILFYFRGIVSLIQTSISTAANGNNNNNSNLSTESVTKSEEYVRKAMRGPPNGAQECDMLEFNLFERAASIDVTESIFGQHDPGRTQSECAVDVYVKTVGATFSACYELQNDHISSFRFDVKPRYVDVFIRCVTKMVVYGRSSAVGNEVLLVSALDCCSASMCRILNTQSDALDQARPTLTTTLMVCTNPKSYCLMMIMILTH